MGKTSKRTPFFLVFCTGAKNIAYSKVFLVYLHCENQNIFEELIEPLCPFLSRINRLTWISHWLCKKERKELRILSLASHLNKQAHQNDWGYIFKRSVYLTHRCHRKLWQITLGFFIIIVIVSIVERNVLQLTSSLIISMKRRKEQCWSKVLNVCALYFRDM